MCVCVAVYIWLAVTGEARSRSQSGPRPSSLGEGIVDSAVGVFGMLLECRSVAATSLPPL